MGSENKKYELKDTWFIIRGLNWVDINYIYIILLKASYVYVKKLSRCCLILWQNDKMPRISVWLTKHWMWNKGPNLWNTWDTKLWFKTSLSSYYRRAFKQVWKLTR